MRITPHPRTARALCATVLSFAVLASPALAANALGVTTPSPTAPGEQAPPIGGTPPNEETPAQNPPGETNRVIDAQETTFEVGEQGVRVRGAESQTFSPSEIVLRTDDPEFDATVEAVAGSTTQPYALSLWEAQAYEVEANSDLAENPAPAHATVTNRGNDSVTETLARSYSAGTRDAANAFDVDHPIATKWSLEVSGEGAADAQVYCLPFSVAGVDETAASLPKLNSYQGVLTVVSGPNSGEVAQNLGGTPCEFPDERAAELNGEAPVDTNAAKVSLVTKLEAEDIPGADQQISAEKFYRAQPGEPLRGLGLAFSGNTGHAQQLAFVLIAAPEEATVTYRNASGPESIFARQADTDEFSPFTQRVLTHNSSTDPVHRGVPTRDAFANWTFSESGVYCVDIASRAIARNATRMPAEPAAEVDLSLKFVVGDVEEGAISAVNCEQIGAGGGATSPSFPSYGDDPDQAVEPSDDPSADTPAENSDGNAGEENQQGAEGMGLPSTNDESSGAVNAQSDGAAADSTPTANPDDPKTKIIAGPAAAGVCPANMNGAGQVRSGEFEVIAGQDLRITSKDGRRTLPSGSTVVIDKTTVREAVAGIDDFVPTQSNYWATGASSGRSAPGFTFVNRADKDLSFEIKQKSGDGKVLVFGPETNGPGVEDGVPGTLPAGETGNLVFGFNSPGEYEVEVTVDTSTTTLKFAVGDENPTSEGVLADSIMANCADASVATSLIDPLSFAPPQDDGHSDGADTNAQPATILGSQWWAIAIAGMALAAILVAFIIGVVLNSRRK